MVVDIHERIEQVCSLEQNLVVFLNFLCEVKGRKSPTGARYANPSQDYLAKRFGVCRATINRALRRLHCLGLIRIQHRRKSQGHWMTCLYTMVRPAAWAAQAVHNLFSRLAHRVTNSSHLVSSQKTSSIPEPEAAETAAQKARFADFIASLPTTPSKFSLG